MTARRSFLKAMGATISSVAAALYAPGLLKVDSPDSAALRVELAKDVVFGSEAKCSARYRINDGEWKTVVTRERDERGNFVLEWDVKESGVVDVDWVHIVEPRV